VFVHVVTGGDRRILLAQFDRSGGIAFEIESWRDVIESDECEHALLD
jgi:hypothetical protein